MNKIRSAKALIAFAEESDQLTAVIRKQLHAESMRWDSLLADSIDTRLSTSARFAGLPEPVIAEYTGSIVASIQRIKFGLAAPIEDLRATSVTMGSVSHCAATLLHRAARLRQRYADAFML